MTQDLIYLPNRKRLLLRGIALFGGGVFVASALVFPMAEAGRGLSGPMLMGVPAIFALSAGIWFLLDAYMGLPQLLLSSEEIRVQTLFGMRSARWDSLDTFHLKETVNPKTGTKSYCAEAKIIGPNVKRGFTWRKTLTITDVYVIAIDKILDDIRAHQGPGHWRNNP